MEFVRATDMLHIHASDDIRVASVEVFWIGMKIHAGLIQAPPYTVELSGSQGIDLGSVKDSAPLFLTALVTDVEGNVDTVEVMARMDHPPYEEGQKSPFRFPAVSARRP